MAKYSDSDLNDIITKKNAEDVDYETGGKAKPRKQVSKSKRDALEEYNTQRSLARRMAEVKNIPDN